MTYQPLIMCYGNTRSNMLTAAVNTHLAHMGLTGVDVQTGGLAKTVEGIYQRAKTTDVGLPEGVISNGNEVDPDYGAILAREFGIPCVVGTRNATELIRDGQKIIVDATQGVIYDAE
jgi:hypothetical protein